MEKKTGNKYSASDLDIFGDKTPDNEVPEGGEADIFNGKEPDDADEGKDDAKSEDKKGEKPVEPKPGDKDEKKDDKGDAEDKDKKPEEGKPESEVIADPELEKLMKELEEEASKKKADMEKVNSLVEDLRKELAQKEADADYHKKRAEAYHEKLMSGSDFETEFKSYEPVIKNLEANPKLMVLAKLWGSSNEKAKDRLIRAAGEVFEELTGEDVSEIFDLKRKEAVIALSKDKSGKAPEAKEEDREDDGQDEPESNKIFGL